MSRERYRGPRNRVSVWNWMGTLILVSIPIVNIIALFLFLFLAKSQPKRSFAAAMLWLTLILAVLTYAALLLFPSLLGSLSEWLREIAPAVEPTTAPIAPLIVP
jgi:cytochrome bd-type quinol oxidase subunit 2